jgi:hypothetical protein
VFFHGPGLYLFESDTVKFGEILPRSDNYCDENRLSTLFSFVKPLMPQGCGNGGSHSNGHARLKRGHYRAGASTAAKTQGEEVASFALRFTARPAGSSLRIDEAAGLVGSAGRP